MGPGEIHVWFARCDRQADSKREWWDTLSAAEKTRAESFRFTRDRARYVAAHSILRELLGRYTGLPPASLRFGTTAHGKPELGQASGRSQLGFNLSHSGDAALYAIAWNRDVGVDLEQIRRMPGMEHVARRTFSEREWTEFCSLTPDDRECAFYRGWTRKEAVVKALGMGLSIPLDSFDVSIRPDESPRVLGNRIPGQEGVAWDLWDATLYAGYWGTVATIGRGARIVMFEWNSVGDDG
jgi:4'-phosphopantetheinyl transferase